MARTVAEEAIGAGYFLTLGETLVAGREFDEKDDREPQDSGLTPLILNQKAAQALFSGENAIGKRLHDGKRPYEVVGVTPDSKDASGMTQPMAYLPLMQRDFVRPPAGGITIIARSDSALDALNGVRAAIGSLDPNLATFNEQTLGEYLELSRYPMRSALGMFGGIGLFGLFLSAIGLAGVTAYAVAQRRKEIGIRLVLGASKTRVLYLVLRESLTLIAAGCAAGFLGAAAIARILSAVTTEFGDAFTVGTSDPRLLVGAPLLLAGLALLACYLPARNATKSDPLKALRQE